MSLGNFFMYSGILAIIACILSLMRDKREQKKKYSAAINDAIKEKTELEETIANLKSELKFFQDTNFYNDYITLEAEKKVWEAEGMQAAKLCQEQSEKITILQDSLKEKELEINKLNLQLEGVKPFEKIPTKVSFGWNHGGKNVRAKVAEGSN